ncbi:hypothetical protein DQ04_12881000 [Trypanosoma grayi]|uniref:hypothetical protein n=1 Tax=Trypanosoma grayi TaxID=71804 RepID=UPI0004F451C1|nr:hypothetical protein DQ04_12881000 [Trypanosoma grayi]KEG06655.1 hypothetical protein DQ04_12881000 [Trypanosoma grayi]
MTENLHRELLQLKNCEPLTQMSGSQNDWLLGSMRQCSSDAVPKARPHKELPSSLVPEEEAVSQGLSRVESASTPPAAQLASIADARSSDKNSGKKTAQKNSMGRSSGASPPCGENLEGTLITLEVSPSSLDSEDVVVSPSRAADSRPRASSCGKHSSSPKREEGLSHKGKWRRATISSSSARDSSTSMPRHARDSVTSTGSFSSVRRSGKLKSASKTIGGGGGDGKKTRGFMKNNFKAPAARAPAALSPRPVLRKNSRGATTHSPSPALPSREMSVATVAAAQKRDTVRAAGASLRANSGANQASPEVFVSSESEGDNALPSPARHGLKQRTGGLPTTLKTNLQPAQPALPCSASVSVSAAVIDVIEVTGQPDEEAPQPSEEWARFAAGATLTHRFHNTAPGFPDAEALAVKAAATAAPEGCEVSNVPFSQMKRVAVEESRRAERQRIEAKVGATRRQKEKKAAESLVWTEDSERSQLEVMEEENKQQLRETQHQESMRLIKAQNQRTAKKDEEELSRKAAEAEAASRRRQAESPALTPIQEVRAITLDTHVPPPIAPSSVTPAKVETFKTPVDSAVARTPVKSVKSPSPARSAEPTATSRRGVSPTASPVPVEPFFDRPYLKEPPKAKCCTVM